MPIDTKHKSYEAMMPLVDRVVDCHGGGDAVKSKGDEYLPMLGGQSQKEFDAYLKRGLFAPAVKRTEKGLTGAIMRKAPVAEIPDSAEFLINDIGGNQSLELLARKCAEQLQITGRYGLLVDHNGERPSVALYARQSIINWSSRYIVLSETYEAFDAKDPYKVMAAPQLRELTYDEKGRYIQRLYRVGTDKKFAQYGEDIMPTRNGDPLTEIPFFVANPIDNSFDDHPPLLLDLADVNLDHYRLATDQRHGLHFTALPTMFIFGAMDTDENGSSVPVKVGPGAVNQISNSDAKAELLEYTGAGLRSIADAMAEDVTLMAAIGARLLQAQRKGVQAAETARIEQSGESATLTTIADSIEHSLRSALKVCVWWLGGDAESVDVTVNKDFIDASMNPQQLTSLTQAWQSGAISLDSFLYNLKRGELLPDGRTIEDEKDLIDEGGEGLDLG